MSSLLSGFWRAAIRNRLIAIVLFVLLVEGLVLFNVAVAYDAVFMISIAASIVGVAYVLTIRNPQNYTGFYLGIVSSALLGIQFYLLGSYDLTFLYFLVFIPFQVMAIYTWLKADKADAPVMLPSYMKGTARIWAIVVFLSIVLLDYALITYWIAPESGALIKIVNGVLIGSSVLANFLLIWKKIDSWIFWIIYSLDGLLLAFLINNTFNVLLFIFFLVINGITTVSWMRDYYRSRASL